MRRNMEIALQLLGTMILICRFSPAAAAPPPAEAFGALPAETSVVLSPDGHWLAWEDHHDAKPRVSLATIPVMAQQTQPARSNFTVVENSGAGAASYADSLARGNPERFQIVPNQDLIKGKDF